MCVCVLSFCAALTSPKKNKSALLFDEVKHDVNMSTDEPI